MNTAALDLLTTLQARGVELAAAGDRLRFRPAEALTPEEVEQLRACKGELLRLLAESRPDPAGVARLLGMSLDRFAREGRSLEIKTPWLDLTLWLVPSEADAEALVREGVSRGRVWTAGELLDLLAIPGVTKEQARTVALVKATFTGEVVEVRAVRPEGR